jgi:predicted secreted protein
MMISKNILDKVPGRFFIATALALFMAAGCSDSFGKEKQNPQAAIIEVNLGGNAVITLEANHTTGFRWQLAKDPDKSMLEFADTQYITEETGLIGSGGQEVWTFKTLKKGKTEVALEYVRPWEKDTPPAREAAFVIIIK